MFPDNAYVDRFTSLSTTRPHILMRGGNGLVNACTLMVQGMHCERSTPRVMLTLPDRIVPAGHSFYLLYASLVFKYAGSWFNFPRAL